MTFVCNLIGGDDLRLPQLVLLIILFSDVFNRALVLLLGIQSRRAPAGTTESRRARIFKDEVPNFEADLVGWDTFVNGL